MWWVGAVLGCARGAPDARIGLDRPLACAGECARAERARAAAARAVPWLAAAQADPTTPVSPDYLITLVPVAARFASPELDALVAAVRPRVDRGGDPRRRAWDPAARLPEDPSAGWTASPGAAVRPNQVLVEVLYCPEFGLRPSTIAWVCADLRDGAGPESGHAAWFLARAVDAGCVPRADTCLDELVDELVRGAAGEPAPRTTEERDRLAEQILFARLGGAPAAHLDAAVDRLIAAQQADGSFAEAPGPPTGWPAVHATLVSTWALAEYAAVSSGSASR